MNLFTKIVLSFLFVVFCSLIIYITCSIVFSEQDSDLIEPNPNINTY